MNINKYYKINRSNVVFEVFETEVVIINLDNGNYFSYNGVGVDIWILLKDLVSINDINKCIIEKYGLINIPELNKIISDSITDLEKENLLITSVKDNNKDSNHKSKNKEISIELVENKFINPVLQKYTDMQDFLLVDPIHEIDYEKWPSKK